MSTDTTLTLRGTVDNLNATFHPFLHFDGKYSIGLADITFWNVIQNVVHKSIFVVGNTRLTRVVRDGYYNFSDIQAYFKEVLPEWNGKIEKHNSKVRLICGNYSFDFQSDDSLREYFGFEAKVFEQGTVAESVTHLKINPVTRIRVLCNVSGGSYNNGKLSHELFSFCPRKGYLEYINERPNYINFQTLLTHHISAIHIRLTDENFRPINLQNEVVELRLIIKKCVDD